MLCCVSEVIREAERARFLRFAAEVWDSVTLQSGVTALVVLGVWTLASGKIVCRVLDIVRVGLSGTGAETAAKVHRILERLLTMPPNCPRLQNGNHPQRSEFLTCCVLDRAYCGRTGNKAGQHLSTLLSLPHRLGLSDGIHCFNSAGDKSWCAKRKAAISSSSSSSDVSNSGSESSEAQAEPDPSADALFPELAEWTWACKAFKNKFRRGIGRELLSSCFARHGIKEETQVQGPSGTRFFTHACSFLQQSLTQYSVRYDCLVDAFLLPTKRKDQIRKHMLVRRIFRALTKLQSLSMIMVLVPLLRSRYGFVHGCSAVQETCVPFFAVHMALLRTGLSLQTFLSLPRRKHGLFKGSQDARSGGRCPVCGWLNQSSVVMQQHITAHSLQSQGDRCAPQRVWRSKFAGPCEVSSLDEAETCSQFCESLCGCSSAEADALRYLLMFLRQSRALAFLGLDAGALGDFMVAWASSSLVAPKLRSTTTWPMLLRLRCVQCFFVSPGRSLFRKSVVCVEK